MPVTSHRLQVFKRGLHLFLQQMSLFAFAQQLVCQAIIGSIMGSNACLSRQTMQKISGHKGSNDRWRQPEHRVRQPTATYPPIGPLLSAVSGLTSQRIQLSLQPKRQTRYIGNNGCECEWSVCRMDGRFHYLSNADLLESLTVLSYSHFVGLLLLQGLSRDCRLATHLLKFSGHYAYLLFICLLSLLGLNRKNGSKDKIGERSSGFLEFRRIDKTKH